MRPRSRRLAALAVAGTVLLSACGASRPPAEDPDSLAPSDSVTGGGGVAFGSPHEGVVEALGEPADSAIQFEGARVLMYRSSAFGFQSLLGFVVHPRDGVIRATYMSTDSMGCELVLGVWHGAMTRKYGRLRVTEPAVPADSACAAFQQGRPWVKRWTDANGRSVMLALSRETHGRVTLTYTTPAAFEWEKRSAPGEL